VTRVALLALAAALSGCVAHAAAPARLPHDARGGFAPPGFDPSRACAHGSSAVAGDGYGRSHASFPELAPERACFTRVRYRGERPTPDAPPSGCGYEPRAHAAAIHAEIARDERIARGEPAPLPLELACALPERTRRAAAAQNARTLRALLQGDGVPSPYAAVAAFGYGNYAHAGTALDAWLPGEACPRHIDLHRFGVNVDRAARAALAYAGHVAPVLVVSGGAVHSRLVEAFLLDYVATCRLGVPSDRVLVDPCADHTHTNVRNSVRLLLALGGRAGYVVTDDSFQAVYLQEWTLLDLFGGSIDQRSRRDFGHILGSWREANVGGPAGFWLTPYRFWADSRWRDFSCEK
jgi:hypothetical protein